MTFELASRNHATLPAGRAAFLAPCLSLVCFIHCAGTALIVPWLPAVGALLGASWLEWPLVGVSGLSAGWLLKRVRAPGRAWLAIGLALACAVGGLAARQELAMRVGLLAIAAAQLTILLVVRRPRPLGASCGDAPVGPGTDCCRSKV